MIPSIMSPSRNSQAHPEAFHFGAGVEHLALGSSIAPELPNESNRFDLAVGDGQDVAVRRKEFYASRLQKGDRIQISLQGFSVVPPDHRFLGGGGGQIFPLPCYYVSNI